MLSSLYSIKKFRSKVLEINTIKDLHMLIKSDPRIDLDVRISVGDLNWSARFDENISKKAIIYLKIYLKGKEQEITRELEIKSLILLESDFIHVIKQAVVSTLPKE